MSNTSKSAPSLTGVVAEELRTWLTTSNERIKINEIVNGEEYLSLERNEEINITILKFFSSICDEHLKLQNELYESLYGKNAFLRRDALLRSCKINANIIENYGLEYFKETYQKKVGLND
jgi:hypothetical protein